MATPRSRSATRKAAEPTANAGKPAEPVESFTDAAAFDRWLAAHHGTSGPILLKLGKGGHPPHLTYAEALDVALAWGWIDSQKRALDDTAWLQRFGPRRAGGPWSKINVAKAQALIDSGRMRPPGLAQVQRAQADGRWHAAYDSPKAARVPDDLQAALAKSAKAARLFATLDGTNRFAILHRVQTAKRPETRTRRIAQFVEMLARGDVPYPDRLPAKSRR
ncbi:MAG: YdeI/OmpD-associated family protein [Deltaproteobacteria bacterium]|nr:YdeI/OmpD-associated family protein [Deltaproteobacteria bacterium]MBK8715879.1 YdeI/OmpD-associated family protein [Deltaproteobacteria bacterium]MBP7286609.1 YdeI/OmpD-associated family protein [Nannocystaceae bacterium]